MPEKVIKPEELDIGMRFRLTGDAENADERNDKHIYTVINKDLNCKLGAHLIVEDETGREREISIMPWVPLLHIE